MDGLMPESVAREIRALTQVECSVFFGVPVGREAAILEKLADRLADQFSGGNPAFNRGAFLRDCGFGE